MTTLVTPLFSATSLTAVGVDPSLTATGIAWRDGRSIVHGRDGLTKDDRPLGRRGLELKQLVVALHNLAVEYGAPDLVVFEELPKVHLDSERSYVWWSLVNAFEAGGIRTVLVQPSQLKQYALGRGSGKGITKGAVIDAAARRLPQFTTGGDDNRADAAWLCAIGMDLLGNPIVTLPQAHRETLKKIKFVPDFTEADRV